MLALLGSFAAALAVKCTVEFQVKDCKENMCEKIGTHEICTECKTPGRIPANGYCRVPTEGWAVNCKTKDGKNITNETTCGSCIGPTHLYKNGCYSCGSIYPGELICKTCGNGVCTKCNDGFFRNQKASQTADSCIKCDNTTGVSGYKGVQGCARCSGPKSPSTTARCTRCKAIAQKPNKNRDQCIKCVIPDCIQCSSNNVCESCGNLKYLQGSARPVCVSSCSAGYYSDGALPLQCKRCHSTCRTCNGPGENDCTSCQNEPRYFLATSSGDAGKCLSCGSTTAYGGWMGVEGCETCITSGGPGKVTCLSCEAGYSKNADNTCKANCDDTSKKCKSNRCNVSVGNKVYCSECNGSNYAPVDGICTDVNTSTTSGCKNADGNATPTDGKCGKCGSGYFLYKGGCYNGATEANKVICKEVETTGGSEGKCKLCADGFQTKDGMCAHCTWSDCKTCNADPGTCEACIDGYYNPSFCMKCHESCKTCSDGGSRGCLTCPDNKYFLTFLDSTGSCVDKEKCGYGFYPDNTTKTCASCHNSCLKCSGSGEDKCTQCPADTHFLDSNSTSEGKCVKCDDKANSNKGVENCQECTFAGGAVKCTVCKPGYSLKDGTCQSSCVDENNCDSKSCTVGIGNNLYCSLCNNQNMAPINGVCTTISADNPSGCALSATSTRSGKGSCEQCGNGYFLYQGGCYMGGKVPGMNVCAWIGVAGVINSENYGPGLCNVCAEGFENKDGICRACTLRNCRQCLTLEDKEVCTHCALGYALDQFGQCGTKTTGTCSILDCAECADSRACKKCNRGFFLTDVGTCISSCRSMPGYYGTDGTDASPARCVKCTLENCQVCGTTGLCTICKNGHFSNNGKCAPCDLSCASCVAAGADKCTSCRPGYAIPSGMTSGKCQQPCQVSKDGCKSCGAEIDSAKYCSACSTATMFPLNGQCTAKVSRSSSACRSVNEGACTECAEGYFLLQGGCYETAKYPGRTVCTRADQGKCTEGANGKIVSVKGVLLGCPVADCELCTESTCTTCRLGYTNVNGKCERCAPGCVTCTAPGNITQCTWCDTGYYKSTTGSPFTCTPCGENNNAITGVSGCTFCVPPESSTGPVLCYSRDALPSVVPSNSDNNRHALNRGTIAGISVAVALAVIGVVVGVLCWHFLCRGKRGMAATPSDTLSKARLV